MCPGLHSGTGVLRQVSWHPSSASSITYLFSLGAWKSLEKEGGESTAVSEED